MMKIRKILTSIYILVFCNININFSLLSMQENYQYQLNQEICETTKKLAIIIENYDKLTIQEIKQCLDKFQIMPDLQKLIIDYSKLKFAEALKCRQEEIEKQQENDKKNIDRINCSKLLPATLEDVKNIIYSYI